MGLLIQRRADLNSFPGERLWQGLIVELVDLVIHQEHVRAALVPHAMKRATDVIFCSEHSFTDHGLVRTVYGVDVLGTLAVHNRATEGKHGGSFGKSMESRRQKQDEQGAAGDHQVLQHKPLSLQK